MQPIRQEQEKRSPHKCVPHLSKTCTPTSLAVSCQHHLLYLVHSQLSHRTVLLARPPGSPLLGRFTDCPARLYLVVNTQLCHFQMKKENIKTKTKMYLKSA